MLRYLVEAGICIEENKDQLAYVDLIVDVSKIQEISSFVDLGDWAVDMDFDDEMTKFWWRQ